MGIYRIGAVAYKREHYQKNKSTYSANHRAYYTRHKAECKANAARSTKKRRHENARFAFEYLAAHPCVDCGESDPLVLEFDHRPKTKSRDVSAMIKAPVAIEKLKTEIAKCDVRCANCHRRKTAKAENHLRYRLCSGF